MMYKHVLNFLHVAALFGHFQGGIEQKKYIKGYLNHRLQKYT
jgi:hypothetical protein